MKKLKPLPLVAVISMVVALSSCAVPPPNEDSAVSSTQSSVTPIAEVTPDFDKPNPMGQNVDSLVFDVLANIPDVTQRFSEEELHDATTFALNWLEQATAIPSLYDKDRNPAVDDITTLQNFAPVIAPQYQQEFMNMLNQNGAVKVFPVANTDGTVTGDRSDGTPVDAPYYFEDSTDIKWSEVKATAGETSTGDYIVQFSAIAEYNTVNSAGQPDPMKIFYQIGVNPSEVPSSDWTVYGWEWRFITE